MQIFYHKELSRVIEARPLCQIIGEMSHRIFDPRVVATAPAADAMTGDGDIGDAVDENNLQVLLVDQT